MIEMPKALTPRPAAALWNLMPSKKPSIASISPTSRYVTSPMGRCYPPSPGVNREATVPSLRGPTIGDVAARTIAHLDMDAFYASVELRRRPELKGKPVVVCGSGPRAVVTTASYEARRLAGIHSAMPAATARRRLPDAIYIPPDFSAYREASREVMAILRANAETVEVVGLDEAYVDLTGLFAPKATMRRISTQIRRETGLTCSIGISENRLLAKITSELGKPAGLVVLSREQAVERFAADSPALVPGIGPKTVAK